MSYHDLSECTLTADERRAEANRICSMLSDDTERMLSNERDFVERVGDNHAPVSVKQLFWLRDIKDRYL
jgi:hypothetical protein